MQLVKHINNKILIAILILTSNTLNGIAQNLSQDTIYIVMDKNSPEVEYSIYKYSVSPESGDSTISYSSYSLKLTKAGKVDYFSFSHSKLPEEYIIVNNVEGLRVAEINLSQEQIKKIKYLDIEWFRNSSFLEINDLLRRKKSIFIIDYDDINRRVILARQVLFHGTEKE